MGWLERRIAAINRDLDDTIQKSPAWRAKEDLLRTVPGIGPVVSRTLTILNAMMRTRTMWREIAQPENA